MKYNKCLDIGLLVLRPKLTGFVHHEGVIVGANAVLHNTPAKGEHVSTLEVFADGKPIQLQRTGANPEIIAARAQQILSQPKSYDLFRRNCQHTTSEIIRGIATSPWAVIATFLVTIAAVWMISLLLRKG